MTAGPDSNAPNLRDLPAPVVTSDLKATNALLAKPMQVRTFSGGATDSAGRNRDKAHRPLQRAEQATSRADSSNITIVLAKPARL